MSNPFDPLNAEHDPTELEHAIEHETLETLDGIGRAFAQSVVGALKDKLYFTVYDPIKEEELTAMSQLQDSLNQLGTLQSFDLPLFVHHVEVRSREVLAHECRNTVTRHTNAIQRGTALIFDEEQQQPVWINIPKKVRPQFSDNIQDVGMPAPLDRDQIEETGNLETYDKREVVTTMAKIIYKPLMALSSEIPTVDDLVNGNTDGITVTYLNQGTDRTTIAIDAMPDNKRIKSIKRKALQLKELIDDFIANPEKTMAYWHVDVLQQAVKQIGQDYAEGMIMERNAALIESLDPSDLKEVKEHNQPEAPKLTKRQRRRARQLAEIATQQAGIEAPESTEEFETIGRIQDVSISLPWINEGQARTLDVDSYTVDGKTVYVVHGIDNKLQEITNETLDKDELEGKIYKAIWHQAKLIASGIMPWDPQNNTARVVHTSSKSPEHYQNDTIWYTYDLRPNAPRVYFMVKDASEIESSETPALQPDAKCVVVAGITDKKNQLDVLKRFTGKTRTELISGNAGAV